MVQLLVSKYFANLFCLVDRFVDPKYMKLNIRFVEVRDLNRILQSEVYIHSDGQLWAFHLILSYIPSYKGFQDPDDTLRAKHPLFPYINIWLKGFLPNILTYKA